MTSSIHSEEIPGQPSVADALHVFQNEEFVLLLDSATPAREQDSRYTFLTADPVETCVLPTCSFGQDPFDTLRVWQRRVQTDPQQETPPFCGGIAGLMSYELGSAFERLPQVVPDRFSTPVLVAGLFDWAIVWDHIESTARFYVLCIDGDSFTASARVPALKTGAGRAGLDAPSRSVRPAADRVGLTDQESLSGQLRQLRRVEWVRQRLDSLRGTTGVSNPEPRGVDMRRVGPVTGGRPESDSATEKQHVPIESTFSRPEYLEAVQRVINYVAAGDIFQANLSQKLMTKWNGSAVELYRQVRSQNAAPFCGLLQTSNFSVVSSSPERFLKVERGRRVETRPIKGTRRRQQLPIADLYTADELSASEKDRAENVMIVDLLRNDISRVCRIGSVEVTGVCEIEVFETVQHLVSTVVGELRPDCDAWDLCAACFPGGSVTGAPKIRAMEIIAELEKSTRGAYCGSLFYCGPANDFDSSILIRTFTLRDGHLAFPVGGAVVADSVPQDEYDETLHKASGMLRTLRN